jgi:hypothetical protein
MAKGYLWKTLCERVKNIEATFSFDKEIGIQDVEPQILFVTKHVEDMQDLHRLYVSMEEFNVVPFIHLVVSEEYSSYEMDVLVDQMSRLDVNYANDASVRMGMLIVTAYDDWDDAAAIIIEMFSLDKLKIIYTDDIDFGEVEAGWDLELVD